VCTDSLHDVLDNTDCTDDRLRHDFGPDIVDLVADVTKLDDLAPRWTRSRAAKRH
jgi:(p)ppGpp synthase/HD superfamily hydrolase